MVTLKLVIRRLAISVLLDTPLEKPAITVFRALRAASAPSDLFIRPTFKNFGLSEGLTKQQLLEVFLYFSFDDEAIGHLDPSVCDTHNQVVASSGPGNWSVIKLEVVGASS